MYRFLQACPVRSWWGGRDMWLFDGPASAVASIGSPHPHGGPLRRRGPQWWWPEDHAWFIGSEIDHPWSYVAGGGDLIDAITANPRIESVVVNIDEPW